AAAVAVRAAAAAVRAAAAVLHPVAAAVVVAVVEGAVVDGVVAVQGGEAGSTIPVRNRGRAAVICLD
ncbi:MAG: hypothetical protein ACRELG_22900, partial [Gemmataceae bacterium]